MPKYHSSVSPIVARPRADDFEGNGEVRSSDVMLRDPIVGIEETHYEDGRGFGALQPRVLPAPKEPTAAQ